MKKYQAENLIVPVLLGSTFLAGLAITLPSVSAGTDIVTDVAITVPASCALSSSVTTEHADEVNNGTYQADIGTTRLKATCNDGDGFAIYAIGYSGDEYGNTKLLSTLDSSHDIITGTATSAGTPDVSNWAMKLTAVSGTYTPSILSDTSGSFSAYHVVPATYTKVASFASTTDNSVGASIDTTYSAYISATQPADTYSGKVKYTMVHPATEPAPYTGETTESGKICYYSGVTDSEGTMGCQTVSASDTSATLLASNFSRSGYGFAGWTDKFDYATNNTAKYYGPIETISFTAGQYTGDNNGLSLYAVWIKSQGSLQDSTKVAQLCGTGTGSLTQAPIDGTANKSSVSALTDERDNQTYAIAKLADGKCWMIENLRLDNTAELTLANTNNPLNDGTNVTLKHNYTDTTTYNTLSAASSVAYNADTAPNGWCNSNSVDCDNQSRLRTDNTASRATDNPNVDTGSMYSYGNYYNWYSATAGRGTYGFGTNNNSVAGDLCPAGWRLPKGGQTTVNTTAEFYLLGKALMKDGENNSIEPNQNASYYNNTPVNATGDTATKAFRRYPNNFLYSGYVDGGSLIFRGEGGNYWSSTADSSFNAYFLYLGSSNVNPGTIHSRKYSGRAVRCITQ